MNIPPETARAQGHHGSKGAPHGIKGGRPRLDLTDEERAERRRQQQETWRRRNVSAQRMGVGQLSPPDHW